MNAPLSSHPLPPYKHTPLFPLGRDTTTYRKLDVPDAAGSPVRVETILGKEMVVVSHEAMRALAEAALDVDFPSGRHLGVVFGTVPAIKDGLGETFVEDAITGDVTGFF